jgi:alkanesulfonate monooxygenase SsuD/methylene tetrahydromethanopterin reductase-like flavin-dependent oxidoreductase (luciferase family)
MKIFFFHLMPYADLDLDYDKTYDSAWVTLPNTYFDPERGHALYNRYLDELEYAEELGFDGVGVNEHHQNAYGIMPSPVVMASALSRRTKRVKIAILGSAIPLRQHPLTLAEEHAMIDVITGGRLITGFVRGIGAEYHSFGVNPTQSHERFHEAHDLIVQAWTKPGPFPFAGKHYHFSYVNIWPRPLQKPHPPIWIPSQGSRETVEWASHPDRRYTYLQTFSPAVQMAKQLGAYRTQARAYGYEATDDQLGWAVPIYVGASDEAALREAKPHIEAFRNKFLRMTPELMLPPGYLSLESMKAGRGVKRFLSERQTCESLIEGGMFICGSPETVARKLIDYHRDIRFGVLMAMLQFGTLGHEATMRSLELFAGKVMPVLKSAAEGRAVGAASRRLQT